MSVLYLEINDRILKMESGIDQPDQQGSLLGTSIRKNNTLNPEEEDLGNRLKRNYCGLNVCRFSVTKYVKYI